MTPGQGDFPPGGAGHHHLDTVIIEFLHFSNLMKFWQQKLPNLANNGFFVSHFLAM